MTDKRTILYIALGFVAFLLFNQWQMEHANAAPASDKQSVTSSATPQLPGDTPASASTSHSTDVPPVSAITTQRHGETVAAAQQATAVGSQAVTIKTDVLTLGVDPKGGNIVSAKLNKYPATLNQADNPVQILTSDPNQLYIAQSGLMGDQGPDTAAGQVTYRVANTHFQLDANSDKINVPLTWTSNKGVTVTKTFTLHRDSYAVDINYAVNNQGSTTWEGNFYAQIQRKKLPGKNGTFGMHTFRGAAISSAQKPYEKITYKSMGKSDLSRTIKGGWLAMQQQYFLSAWVADSGDMNHYFTRVRNGDIYTIGFVGPQLSVKPGDKATTGAKFYVGPEIQSKLATLAPNLDLTIDFGWLWIFSSPIFWIMKKIHGVVGNWGWSIILVTLMIKLLFYKLSEKSYRSMSSLKELQPRLEAIKERYANDKQAMTKATMELYKKEKVNPMGGCLPMLIQIPVFIALYYVLIEAVQLRHAPFIFWIHDLSSKDPYYILPVLMGLTMLVQQKLNPPPPDPMQAKIMMLMPILFTVFFMTFPAGLVLYWFVNSLLSLLQQWWIMSKMEKAGIKKKK